MRIDVVGWDLGGAHVKAVAVDAQGAVIGVVQHPCPLWLGLEQLQSTLLAIGRDWPIADARLHAVTMTGELTDHFPDRATGVRALLGAMRDLLSRPVQVFIGQSRLLDIDSIMPSHLERIASANWLASAHWLCRHWEDGILIDIGSTTTDLIPLIRGRVCNRGYTDHERLRYDELVYMGIVRTPLMAIASKAPFEGGWVSLMNEHFATSADIFRLSGELPEHADQWPSADHGPKDIPGSARRIARMIGRDLESAPLEQWIELASFFRGRLLDRLCEALSQSISEDDVDARHIFVGAGTGRFLVRALAGRFATGYRDVDELLPSTARGNGFLVADCLPAAAVAWLAWAG